MVKNRGGENGIILPGGENGISHENVWPVDPQGLEQSK